MAVRNKKKAVKKAKGRIGARYVCGICGLSVVVDEDCCCEQSCDLVCCNERMTRC